MRNLLADQHLLDKELVQPLVSKIHAELLVRVDTEHLESKEL